LSKGEGRKLAPNGKKKKNRGERRNTKKKGNDHKGSQLLKQTRSQQKV